MDTIGGKFIVYINANEEIRRCLIGELHRKIGLKECLVEKHSLLHEPNLLFREGKQIEGVWVSEDIEVESCRIIPFIFGIRDHRNIFIDMNYIILIGKTKSKLLAPKDVNCRVVFQKLETNTLDFSN